MLEIKKIVTNPLRNGTAYTTILLVLKSSSPAGKRSFHSDSWSIPFVTREMDPIAWTAKSWKGCKKSLSLSLRLHCVAGGSNTSASVRASIRRSIHSSS